MLQLLEFICPSYFSLTDIQCSLLQKNVREIQPACLDSSLPSDEEMKCMKVGILESF